MGTLFYLNEILNFALEREQESHSLYDELAKTVESPELKEMFTILATEELQHKETYAQLLSTVEHNRTPSAQGYDEYDEYMRTLIAQARTITSPPVGLDNFQDILDFAIEREKDAVLFYVGLENYVPENDTATIKTIIKEEGRHIVKLSRIKKELG